MDNNNEKLSKEERESILANVAKEVQDMINGFGEITVIIGSPAFSKYSLTKSVQYEPEDDVFKIQIVDDIGQPFEIEPSKFIGREDLNPDENSFNPTLFFDGLTVEFECIN